MMFPSTDYIIHTYECGIGLKLIIEMQNLLNKSYFLSFTSLLNRNIVEVA